MINAPTLAFAHFLGRPKKSEISTSQKLAKLRHETAISRKGVAKSVADRTARRADITQRVAVLLEKPRSIATTKSAPAKPSRAAYAHLDPAPAGFYDDYVPPAGSAKKAAAAFLSVAEIYDADTEAMAASMAWGNGPATIEAFVQARRANAPDGTPPRVRVAGVQTATGIAVPPQPGSAVARFMNVVAKVRCTDPPPLPSDPTARAVVLAGRKRRGEI